MARRGSQRMKQMKRRNRLKSPEARAPIHRRQFVRVAGGMLVATGLGCTPLEGGPQGTLDLTINGLGTSATSGGTAVVTPTGGTAVTVDIPKAGHQTQILGVG